MNHFMAELIGTFILILLGDGVVANVVLNKSKAQNAGWMVITTGWAFAVTIPVYLFGGISGAHFNPAVTLGLAITGKFPWAEVPMYLLGQFAGAFLGAALVFVFYYKHFEATEDKPSKLAVFCTAPAIKSDLFAFISEFVGTFVLLFGILGITSQEMAPGLSPFIVGILIWTIGICLGGTTGYAINPARDLGPRIAHAILPIPGKGSSDWGYSWIPIIAPILGGIAGALTYVMLF